MHLGNCNGTEPERFKRGLTQEEAVKLLRKDAATRSKAVDDLVNVPLTQTQFDALVSFVFNVGADAFRNSTLLRKLNAGDYASVPSELNRWTRAGGRVLSGLVTRRKAEGELFRNVKYE